MADRSGLHGAEHMEAKTFHCMGNISKTNYKYTCPHFLISIYQLNSLDVSNSLGNLVLHRYLSSYYHVFNSNALIF